MNFKAQIQALVAERNRSIADEYFSGADLELLAEKHEITPLTVRQIAHSLSNGRRRKRPLGNGFTVLAARDAAICEEYLSGDSLETVGNRYGITRERVRQILSGRGHAERHNGFNSERRVTARVAAASREEKRQERKAVQAARRARIRELYNSGHTYLQIAELTGQGTASILNDLWATGGPSRNALAGQTNRKLTVADREEILRRFSAGEGLNSIAKDFGVVSGTVSNIAYMHGARRPRDVRASH